MNRIAYNRQRGVALVMAMVMLVILTILGLSAMHGSIMEARMTGNLQDNTAAFQTAESGLAKALNLGGSFDIHTTKADPNNQKFIINNGRAIVDTYFNMFSPPKRGSGFSNINYDVANFTQRATGLTISGGRSVTNQGVYQVINKAS